MSNRLIHETSPYLLQHAHNPVDWYPWGEDAFRAARDTGKPILLSIGYAACHWCHVMAHESFENSEIAHLMNEKFINVKVDREERPDLDQIYQSAHTMITRRNGGWPLTMFLASNQVPFAGGTYFPRVPRFGLPGFASVLEQIHNFYAENRTVLEGADHPIVRYLGQTNPVASQETVVLDDRPVRNLLDSLKSRFDSEYGGFSGAPKFPHPTDLLFCLRRSRLEGDPTALEMVRLTLYRMLCGGIWDQVGGGFSRYSVDDRWMIPHFEKMLYDNGLLLEVLAKAYSETRETPFVDAAEQLVEWLFRDMKSPEGGYYSSLDADSEGEEGRYYVWTPDEVRSILSEDEFRVASEYFGLSGPPNFEGQYWHLFRAVPSFEKMSERLRISEKEVADRIASSRRKLLEVREKRVHPGLDDKILASWNALAARGLIVAGSSMSKPDWISAGQSTLDFIRNRMWTDKRLKAVYKDGKAPLPAYLDDYSYLLSALLASMEARFRMEDLVFAIELADAMRAEFEDGDQGGFFFTGHSHERLIHRPKSGHDGAIPSGNGMAALGLIRLSHLTGNIDYLDSAGRTLRLFFPQMVEQSPGYTSLITALESELAPPAVILMNGPDADAWKKTIRETTKRDALIVDLANSSGPLPQAMEKPFSSGKTMAYVCRDGSCLPPADRLDTLIEQVRADSGPSGELH